MAMGALTDPVLPGPAAAPQHGQEPRHSVAGDQIPASRWKALRGSRMEIWAPLSTGSAWKAKAAACRGQMDRRQSRAKAPEGRGYVQGSARHPRAAGGAAGPGHEGPGLGTQNQAAPSRRDITVLGGKRDQSTGVPGYPKL